VVKEPGGRCERGVFFISGKGTGFNFAGSIAPSPREPSGNRTNAPLTYLTALSYAVISWLVFRE